MNNSWLKFGCFLTGYKYDLIKHCSIASEKSVIKYTSAILLVCTIWIFIGFSFTHRYLKGGLLESILGALVLLFVVIQIERQIILTIGKNKYIFWFRGILAIVMAVMGSILLDQIIFKDDIDNMQKKVIQDKVNSLLPGEIAILNTQINNRDSIIKNKEAERSVIINRVLKDKTITLPSVKNIYGTDSTGALKIESRTITSETVPNPEANLLPGIQIQIDTLRAQKSSLESKVLNSRERLAEDQNKLHPFLEELKSLIDILLGNFIALAFYVLLWSFFFLIELLVLFSKLGDNRNDYEQTILHQMNIRIQQLKALNP